MSKSKKQRTADDELVPVGEYALIRRINRILKKRALDGHKECQLLKTHGRDEEKMRRVGEFYVVSKRSVVRKGVHLETFAREQGALAPWEALVS